MAGDKNVIFQMSMELFFLSSLLAFLVARYSFAPTYLLKTHFLEL